jgi:hypothetical protein
MDRFLRNADYLSAIQSDNLLQIIENDWSNIYNDELAAQDEIEGYLGERYIMTDVFNPIQQFATSSIYNANQIVEYTEADYVTGSFYNPNDRVNFNSTIYTNVSATGSTGSPGDGNWIANWQIVCANDLLFYVTYPAPLWDSDKIYNIGDIVFYEGLTYSASRKHKERIPNHQEIDCIDHNVSVGMTPFRSSRDISTLVVPTTAYWSTYGVTFSVTDVYPDDITKWTKGDNRNSQIKMYLLDIILYHVHCRINPRNIPDLRKERYDGNGPMQLGGAIGWLKNVWAGKVSVKLPEFVPYVGNSISWGADFYRNNLDF